MTSGAPLSPGTYVKQVQTAPIILPPIATAIGGFMLYSQMGPVGVPIQVISTNDAAEVYGQAPFGYNLPGVSRILDTLTDFFAEGGASCYVMRFVGVGAAVGARNVYNTGLTSGFLRSKSYSFPVAIPAADTFIGKVNGAGALTATINATAATYTGTAATFAAVAAGHTLTVFIAGQTGNQIITFNGTENSIGTFESQLNAQLKGASASTNGGQIELTTTVLGSSAAGQIISGSTDVLASLGFAVASFTNAGPNNVANTATVQASELASLFNSVFTGSTTVANSDGSVTWSSSTLGSTSSVQLTGGTGEPLVSGFNTLVNSGSGTLPIPVASITAAMGIYANPGSWANAWSTQNTQVNTYVTNPAPTAAGTISTLVVGSSARLNIGDTFSITTGGNTQRSVISGINGNQLSLVTSITVPTGGYVGTEQVIQETFNVTVYNQTGSSQFPSPFTGLRMSALSSNYYVAVINSANRTPINVIDLGTSPSSSVDNRPITDAAPVNFAGGADGASPVVNDVVSLINNWNQSPDVNFISIPGVATDFSGANGVSILTSLQAYLITRADVMGIVDEPSGTPALGTGGARDWMQNTANLATSYMAAYWPWVGRLSALTGILTYYPPSPHVQGVWARVSQNENFAAVPAGIEDGQLLNIQALQTYISEGGPEYNDFYPANVNGILKFPGAGIAIYGSRTLDPTGVFGQVNVQHGFNIAKRVVKKGMRFVNFEFNSASTRASVVRVLTATFRQWRIAGILQGTKDSDAFFIVCDSTNNTPLVIAQGLLICRIGLAFNVPVEFSEYTLEQNTAAVNQQLAQQTATTSSASS